MQSEWKTFLQNHGAEFDGQDYVLSFGGLQRERNLALTGTVITDLSHTGTLFVHGADAEDFLQGQFTNDVRHLDGGHSQLNGYCSPKGRLLATFRLFRADAGFMLCMPHTMLDAVSKRLRMFVMRSAVVLEDVSECGYALDRGECVEGIQCVSAPVFERNRTFVAALTVIGPTTRLSIPRLKELAPTVIAHADKISRRLGYEDGDS